MQKFVLADLVEVFKPKATSNHKQQTSNYSRFLLACI